MNSIFLKEILTIINGCRERNHKYQQILYDRYRAFALKIVFRYIYNYEEALEVTNDGFVKFYLSIEKFRYDNVADNEKLLAAWIKKIMINTSIDLLRKKMLLPEIGGIPEYVWDIKDNNASSDQQVIYKDLIKLVKKLPPAYRIVFNMYVIDGYSHMEIADTLKIPVGTSKSNLSRARLLMQQFLDQKEELTKCSV
ncbi:MAG: RNA polymerase sigma factor [Ferruginibacter sp.]